MRKGSARALHGLGVSPLRTRVCQVLIALALATAALGAGLAAKASADEGTVWLDWVHMDAGGVKYAAFKYLLKAQAEPLNYRWGCANMYNGSSYIFSDWYCGAPGTDGSTPGLTSGRYSEPAAWNDSENGQEMWAWEYYEA